jgi:hypothetical protein
MFKENMGVQVEDSGQGSLHGQQIIREFNALKKMRTHDEGNP